MFSSARRRLAVAKVPQTLDYVRGAIDQGEKVVLFSCFTHATRRFERALGEQAVTITGEVPTAKRQGIVDRFQNDDSVRVLIGQIHAAGVGINLTAARQVVFNDLDWVPANHWQAEDRTHRIGQTGTVNVTYMIARDTLEEFVRAILETKARIVDDVVEGKALGESMESDVLVELRRMTTYLDEAARSGSDGLDQTAIEDLLRTASERYIAERAPSMSRRARRDIKPVSERAIRALAQALAGPARVVYLVASASDPKAPPPRRGGRGRHQLRLQGIHVPRHVPPTCAISRTPWRPVRPFPATTVSSIRRGDRAPWRPRCGRPRRTCRLPGKRDGTTPPDRSRRPRAHSPSGPSRHRPRTPRRATALRAVDTSRTPGPVPYGLPPGSGSRGRLEGARRGDPCGRPCRTCRLPGKRDGTSPSPTLVPPGSGSKRVWRRP